MEVGFREWFGTQERVLLSRFEDVVATIYRLVPQRYPWGSANLCRSALDYYVRRVIQVRVYVVCRVRGSIGRENRLRTSPLAA